MMEKTPRIRLLLVSPHTLTRSGLVRLIAERRSLQLVGEVGTRLQALTQAAEHTPDVILLEPLAESELWLDAVGPLAMAAGRQARVLLLTGLTDPDVHRQALRLGARGVVHQADSPETLFRAIEQVHGGDVWMGRRLMADLLTAASGGSGTDRARLESLTPREREVVRLVSQGLKNKEIAERLSIADVTVRHHLTSVFSKVGVSDRLSLIVFAYDHALAHPRCAVGHK